MALLRAGFFRELRHGDSDGPSLREARDTGQGGDDETIGAYLRAGNILAATAMPVDDILDATKTNIADLTLMTDGTWLWPSDLPYYVETYGVAVPAGLQDHIVAHLGNPPKLSARELAALENELFD